MVRNYDPPSNTVVEGVSGYRGGTGSGARTLSIGIWQRYPERGPAGNIQIYIQTLLALALQLKLPELVG